MEQGANVEDLFQHRVLSYILFLPLPRIFPLFHSFLVITLCIFSTTAAPRSYAAFQLQTASKR